MQLLVNNNRHLNLAHIRLEDVQSKYSSRMDEVQHQLNNLASQQNLVHKAVVFVQNTLEKHPSTASNAAMGNTIASSTSDVFDEEQDFIFSSCGELCEWRPHGAADDDHQRVHPAG